MKKFFHLAMSFAMMLGVVSFSACGDDDEPEVKWEDPDAANKGNLNIAGHSADIKYCNMRSFPLSEDDGSFKKDEKGNIICWCEIRYSSWDMTVNWENQDSIGSILLFGFFGPADSKGEFLSGTNIIEDGGSGCINQNNNTGAYDLSFDFEETTITIERGANGMYTVTVPMKGTYKLANSDTEKSYSTTFKYVGRMDNLTPIDDLQ